MESHKDHTHTHTKDNILCIIFFVDLAGGADSQTVELKDRVWTHLWGGLPERLSRPYRSPSAGERERDLYTCAVNWQSIQIAHCCRGKKH